MALPNKSIFALVPVPEPVPEPEGWHGVQLNAIKPLFGLILTIKVQGAAHNPVYIPPIPKKPH